MSERFAWIYDKVKRKKIWVADMWSRNSILTILDNLTSKTYTPTGGWTWGASFDASGSAVYCRRMHNTIQITFAAKVSTAIGAATSRNIITNLPGAMTRVYSQAFMVTFNSGTPATITPVMCAIRPEEAAANSNQILKVDGATNPTAIPVAGTIYGTVVYISNDW